MNLPFSIYGLRKLVGCFAIGVLVSNFSPVYSYGAPLLLVDGNGVLLGAKGVKVDGYPPFGNPSGVYDVEFLDGSCIGLFEGCDFDDDFLFRSKPMLQNAAKALFEQVFLDVAAGTFDSTPYLTRGCESASADQACRIYLPVDSLTEGPTGGMLIGIASNFNDSRDAFDMGGLGRGDDTGVVGEGDSQTYARFTRSSINVPEPTTLALLGLGLAGLGLSRRKRA